jgi:hypothetical protein
MNDLASSGVFHGLPVARAGFLYKFILHHKANNCDTKNNQNNRTATQSDIIQRHTNRNDEAVEEQKLKKKSKQGEALPFIGHKQCIPINQPPKGFGRATTPRENEEKRRNKNKAPHKPTT